MDRFSSTTDQAPGIAPDNTSRPSSKEPVDSIRSPDLEIRVTIENRGSETRLNYQLHSSSDRQAGYHYHTIPSKPLKAKPEDYHTALLREIERLQAGKRIDGSLVLREEVPIDLTALGRKLYRELFPPEMRAAYRDFRKTVTTLLITSEEPWIPWEMIKPYDDEQSELIDDDFLCIRFELTRWLSGGSAPAAVIGVERLVCVEAGSAVKDNQLPNAELELKWLQDLASRYPEVDDLSLPRASYPEVKRRLEQGDADVLHFAGHGSFEPTDPDQSSFYLADGRPFRPLDLHGEIQTRTKHRRPLVFLNACRVGRQDYSLTGLGGWAPRWVTDCGCGAFIAPLWPVDDHLAHVFAIAFYSALENGETFGYAAQTARRQVRELNPSKPTWLAYTVYAHPNGRWQLGRRTQHLDSPGEPPILAVRLPSQINTLDRHRTEPSIENGPPGRPIYRAAAGSHRRRLLLVSLLALGALLILFTIIRFGGKSAEIPNKNLTENPTSTISEGDPPQIAESTDESGAASDEQQRTDPIRSEPSTSSDSPSQPTAQAVARKTPSSVEESETSAPLLQIVPGKVGIVVLDSTSRQLDSEAAEAIESVLSSAIENINPTTPQVDPALVERLLDGDYSIWPNEGHSPWGAEHLLLATVTKKQVPQKNPALEGVILTIRAHLISTATRSVRLRDGGTHTGLGGSHQQALAQAAERCLRETVTILTENQP